MMIDKTTFSVDEIYLLKRLNIFSFDLYVRADGRSYFNYKRATNETKKISILTGHIFEPYGSRQKHQQPQRYSYLHRRP